MKEVNKEKVSEKLEATEEVNEYKMHEKLETREKSWEEEDNEDKVPEN